MQEKFSREVDGYNKREVNKFIGEVIEMSEGIIKKCQDQQNEIDRLNNELLHYKKLEQQRSSASIYADNVKNYARDEADIIISDAKNNANRILNDALIRANEIDIKRELLEKNMQIFRRKLKIILTEQESIIDEIDKLELFDNK